MSKYGWARDPSITGVQAAAQMRPIIATHFDFLIEQYGCQKSERWVSYEFHSEYVKGRIEVADPDGTSHIEIYSSIDEFVDTHRARKSRSWRVFRSARNFWMSMVLGITLLAMAVYYFL